MEGMNITSRYADIAERSGLSEEVVRRVLKASRESLAVSIKSGERATLPGLCIMIPEIKRRINVGGTMSSSIKIKAKPSASMESEVEKLESFNKKDKEVSLDDESLQNINFKTPEELGLTRKVDGIRTSQISALL